MDTLVLAKTCKEDELAIDIEHRVVRLLLSETLVC